VTPSELLLDFHPEGRRSFYGTACWTSFEPALACRKRGVSYYWNVVFQDLLPIASEDLFGGVEGDQTIRSERIHEAVMEHGYTLTAFQRHLGLHPSTLSRIVKRIGDEKSAKNKV